MLASKTEFVMKQLTLEESKEANTATREAAHKISRGLHNKVVRVLNNLVPLLLDSIWSRYK